MKHARFQKRNSGRRGHLRAATASMWSSAASAFFRLRPCPGAEGRRGWQPGVLTSGHQVSKCWPFPRDPVSPDPCSQHGRGLGAGSMGRDQRRQPCRRVRHHHMPCVLGTGGAGRAAASDGATHPSLCLRRLCHDKSSASKRWTRNVVTVGPGR